MYETIMRHPDRLNIVANSTLLTKYSRSTQETLNEKDVNCIRGKVLQSLFAHPQAMTNEEKLQQFGSSAVLHITLKQLFD
jgi:hypothetical protein